MLAFVAAALRLMPRPQLSTADTTAIAFHFEGLEIADVMTAKKRFVPFAEIRFVKTASEAVIVGAAWMRFVIIPRRALPGDGAQVMQYFDDHLVEKRQLRRSPVATTIFNTMLK